MNKHLRTAIFISVLCVLIAFLAGMRYGKFVQKLDNVYVPKPSLSPTPAVEQNGEMPTDIDQPKLSFSTYSNRQCRVSFVYPSHFKASNLGRKAVETTPQATSEALLNTALSHEFIYNEESIFVSCDPADITEFRQVENQKTADGVDSVASKEARLGSARGTSYNIDSAHTAYLIRNPILGRDILIRFPLTLETLIRSTFKLSAE